MVSTDHRTDHRTGRDLGRLGVGPNLAYLMDLVADPAAARRIMAAAEALRTIGHLAAPVNPLPELDPPLDPSLVKQLEWLATDSFDEFAGLPAALAGGPVAPDADDAQDALSRLRQIYLGPAGYEFGHLRDSARREWLEERIEGRPGPPFPAPRAKGWRNGSRPGPPRHSRPRWPGRCWPGWPGLRVSSATCSGPSWGRS